MIRERLMSSQFKQLTDFLLQMGTEGVAHTGKNYLAHLIGVYRDLEAWGASEEICRAGMFHSIYGTELFQKFALPLAKRGDVQTLIGERAERLAYVNCVMDRATFDRALENGTGPYRIKERATGQEIDLSPADFDDLCRVHLCDWLEQVPRSQNWSYRRDSYRRMAGRLGGVAQEAYERVYGQGAGVPALAASGTDSK
jgi:uncharacterized protein DUF6817